MRQLYYVFFGIVLFIASCSPKLTFPIDDPSQNIALDVITLSSDYMEGRMTGSEGEARAAGYLVKRFKEIGLEPKGDNGTYFQTFSRKASRNPHADEATSDAPLITGKNVIGYINNNANTTVVIGAHYDHLGFGSISSLAGNGEIHNGADDNASGVAGVLFLAESIKKSQDVKNNNYLFICISGEELGLWGSNYFVNNTTYDKNKFNYMVNMDMIGRLKDRNLAISGVGSSPVFEPILDKITKPQFNIKKTASGLGGSDHSSFYNAGIPVLSFFTGMHSDYHKPSDKHEFINYSGMNDVLHYIYSVVWQLDNKKSKFPYTKAHDDAPTRMTFSVTLGVMPDYMFDGLGMKLDGVREDKPAALAGIEKGDIITKMGDMEIKDVQDYMKSLSTFNKGDTIDILVIRDGKPITVKATF